MRKRLKIKSHVIAVLLAFGIFTAISGGALWIFFVLVKIPSIDNFRERQVAESTKLYDKTGQVLLWEIHGEEKRTIVPSENISRYVKNATIAIEDSSFYSHHGFSFVSFFRVIVLNALQGKKIGSGGSTITQQLVKNTILTNEQTIARKLKEIIIAIKLERSYSKDEILNLYLNEIPYGSNAYGIEAASQSYFGKSAERVTLAESAYLAALPNAPTYYSPYGNHRKELEQRKNLALERMKSLEFITDEEYKTAKEENVTFNPQQKQGLRAPHFVMYVRELLVEKYGEDMVEHGGLHVITTLDTKLQEKAEEVVNNRAAELQEKFNASNEGLVAIDPKTGRILAMVGSRDYFDIKHEGNFNITLAHRQPGSAFKPIVYATAFKKGYTPDTVLFDLETNFAVFGTPYTPQNYDEKFRGPITMRDALAQSLNVPAVKTLYLAGIQNSIETARDFGISTLADASRYGLTLVLGGGEVSPLELTSAYGTFANQGMHCDKHAILEIRDKNNTTIEQE
ncbi:MAG: transglycosylase domain-containing protein, partial [Patescibacteria group bacterium]